MAYIKQCLEGQLIFCSNWAGNYSNGAWWPTCEKEDDNDRVDDGEPVDLDVTHVQVGVPPRCPLHFTWFPCDFVCKYHLSWPWQQCQYSQIKHPVVSDTNQIC